MLRFKLIMLAVLGLLAFMCAKPSEAQGWWPDPYTVIVTQRSGPGTDYGPLLPRASANCSSLTVGSYIEVSYSRQVHWLGFGKITAPQITRTGTISGSASLASGGLVPDDTAGSASECNFGGTSGFDMYDQIQATADFPTAIPYSTTLPGPPVNINPMQYMGGFTLSVVVMATAGGNQASGSAQATITIK